ncbi:MAG: sugar phosphate isomerase/epimerase [Chitinophagaceae bacterium]|nr:MAG: sugar phosphate isomerase/epimerase [Chitinophagaceae bacterium]
MSLTRRTFLKGSVLIPTALPLLGTAAAGATDNHDSAGNEGTLKDGKKHNPIHPDGNLSPISIFSKALHFLHFEEMAETVAGMGFDGIDLTVRPEGHVLPENVERDLPEAIRIFKKYNLQVYSIVTTIRDAEDPLTERILATAGKLGIGHYRMDWIRYNDLIPVEQDLANIEKSLIKLSALNAKYKIYGGYQNHSGRLGNQTVFGGPVWDLGMILKKINSPWLGCQYDIYHATAEAVTSWPSGFRFITPHIRSIALKDFKWNQADGRKKEPVPMGKGLIDFAAYFRMLKQAGVNVPISIHCEYGEHGQGRNFINDRQRSSICEKSDEQLITHTGRVLPGIINQ